MESEADNPAFVDTNNKNKEGVDDILSEIESKLCSKEEVVVYEALHGFKTLLDDHDDFIPTNIFAWTKKIANDEIEAVIVDKLQQQIMRILKQPQSKLSTIIPKDTTDLDTEYLEQMLMNAVNPMSDEFTKQLMCDNVIPTIFDDAIKDSVSHHVIINFGFSLIVKCPITKLSPPEVRQFSSKLIEKYVKVLEKWTEQNFSRWHDLWMFLVRFSAKHLHTAMDLANKLLRVVEYAFRSPSFEQRLLGYDCWKELIDNRSLDMKLMCSNKQIKLLIAPLRAKFFKMEVVILKRFEIFLYLLEKLQGNSVLCLNEFLEFCFGVSSAGPSSKNGQGKLVPNLWLRSIQVFLAILGDRKYTSKELKRQIFKKAIIDESNIERFDQVIVFSIVECSTILKTVQLDIPEKINILKSLWILLFDILKKSSKEVQENCFRKISASLGNLFKDFNEDLTHLSLLTAFADLSKSSMDSSIYFGSFKIVIEHAVNFLNEEVVSVDLKDQFKEILRLLCDDKDTFVFLTEQLKKLESTKNEEIVYQLWKDLGFKMAVHGENSNSAFSVLLWPILHLNKCTNFTDNVCERWAELFLQRSSSDKILIIKEIDKAFKSNPLLCSNISSVLSVLSIEDIILEEDTVDLLLKLMASIMCLPLLSREAAEKLFPLILKCTNVVVESGIELEIAEYIVHCLQKIPDHQKNVALLETMESLAKKLVPHANTPLVKKLKLITGAFSSPKLQKRAMKISNLLSPDAIVTPSHVKRSVRMTQMVFDKEGSTPKKDKVEALQLFGKDVETLTPLKVKGSLLQNPSTLSSRSKKIVLSVKKQSTPVPPIDDEQTCEFAVIDTEVKLRKDLLTDHQKEKLRERREDIPALYQDLSQSQTRSLSLDSQSNHVVADKNEKNETAEESMDFQKLEITTEENSVIGAVESLKNEDSNADSGEEGGNRRGKKGLAKSERELLRIQMDIVGGNSFIQNLPSKRPRKVNEKVTTDTPKRKKKTETETSKNENSDEKLETDPNPTKDKESNEENPNEIDQTSVLQPVVAIENIPLITGVTDQVSSPSTPSRRKNNNPVKNFSDKKKKTKTDKNDKKNKKKQTLEENSEQPSQDFQSEILFESEMNTPKDKQPRPVGRRRKHPKSDSPENEKSKGETEITKPKKSPKELMKKTKAKVRVIQSQLKLANLSNLEVTSEPSKPKNAKLIFIRELTNPQHSQDAGLKRNKDDKAVNIAYAFEAPSSSLQVSPPAKDEAQPSCSKEDSDGRKVKSEKRRRASSEGTLGDVSSLEEGKECKVRRVKLKKEEVKVEDTKEEINVQSGEEKESEKEDATKSVKSEVEEENNQGDVSTESSLFSPESPSGRTRSRTNSPQKVSPGVVRPLFKDSEDIIESSQGSVENTSISISNISKSRLCKSPKLHNGDGQSEEVRSSPQVKNETSPESKTDKPISQATTLTCESSYEPQPTVVQVDVPERQELSDSEKLLSMADTVSIESLVSEDTVKKNQEITNGEISDENAGRTESKSEDEAGSPVWNPIEIEIIGTPQKNGGNLPGSPVSNATPTFKKELLNNTLDISPIGCQTSEADHKMEQDIIAALDEAIGETVEPPPKDKPPGVPLTSNERSNKLLNMVNVESPVSSQKKISKRKLASPALKKTRYEKLFSFYKDSHNGDAGKNEEDVATCKENQEDILTFSREVPSPLAVPSGSILKRKLADTDDSYSPCPKRKRVNFSYPCITSTKLFIRHKDELNTNFKATFAPNFFEDEPQQEDSEEEDPFMDREAYAENGSEECREITNSLSLCSNKPIDERLLNCEDNLDSLWTRLSIPSYCDKLKNLLNSKNIENIGDLASLNEVEINKLPFKDPKVKSVKKALSHYFKNIYSKPKDKEENVNVETLTEEDKDSRVNEVNGNHETEEISNEKVQDEEDQRPENIKDEFRIILRKVKERETSLEEFGDLFIDLVDESELINLLENVYNTNFRKFFGKPHWRYLVENIVKSGGTLELFDIISDLAENNKVFAEQLEHIVQLRIEQDPLKNILKKKTLIQVGLALQECIEEGEFRKENVLQTCLMPLIKNPSDIRNYFNSLTIVQIHDLFIERVQPSDLTCFLDQIKEHYGTYTIAQCANKQDVLRICSKEDLADSLIEKEGDVGAVKELVSRVSDQSKLLELYKYIGSLMPLKSRIEAHIDMLKSISFDENA